MAQIIIDIKDGYEIKVAKDFANFQYDPKKVPPLEEHLLAIKSKIDELIYPSYLKAIDEDSEVIALKEAYELKRKEKEAAIATAQIKG